MSDEPRRYSILLRLRRVTTEYAYVNVPVTDAIMTPADAQERATVDTTRLVAEGIRYAADPDVRWIRESQEVGPHPTQTPLPEDYSVKNRWDSLRPANETENE